MTQMSAWVAMVAFIVGAGLMAIISRLMGLAQEDLVLVVGAILGTAVGVVAYSRQGDASLPSLRVKLQLGGALAAATLLVGIGLQIVLHWFTYPQASLLIGAIGAFVCPLVLGRTFWQAFVPPAMPANETNEVAADAGERMAGAHPTDPSSPSD